MKLSFSTRGWSHLSWEECLDIGVNMDFEGVEVYNLPKFPELMERSAPFHKYNMAATVRQLYEKRLCIPCFDTSCDISAEDCTKVPFPWKVPLRCWNTFPGNTAFLPQATDRTNSRSKDFAKRIC